MTQRRFTFWVLVASLASSLNAQDVSSRYGILAGISSTYLTGTSEEGSLAVQKSQRGFSLGVVKDIQPWLRAAVHYNMAGSRLASLEKNYDIYFHSIGLDIQPLFRMKRLPGRPYFVLGPRFDILLFHHHVGGDPTRSSSRFSHLNAGLVMAGGLDLEVGGHPIGIEFQYHPPTFRPVVRDIVHTRGEDQTATMKLAGLRLVGTYFVR